ncbi:hypothetical protein ILUMI_07211 [Ignelater luminosus]|uniref:XK-related protein n=1 Tax=Ignelater luminosus TaxID=2038154 RepID=A0A8K0GBT5_IGNLU|nr:hypothetical protein ILUMI_07211 [Ignelater luminosus]
MMTLRQNKPEKEIVINPTVLGYEVDTRQNVIANHLVPSIIGCLFYIIHFACDFTVAYRHFREDNSVWGSLTIFFMFLPVLGCYILIISSWELWPEYEKCGLTNVKWVLLKTAQHMYFPVWSMWRYAERIFWSIEGMRTTDEEERENIMKTLNAPRTIELYFFLQGYLQAVSQILFQMHILMHYVGEMEKQTIDALALSIIMSVAQMAKVTTLYQRFKSQKLAGKHYPWFKPYKLTYDSTVDHVVRRSIVTYRCRPSTICNTQGNNVERNSQGQPILRDSQNEVVTLRERENTDENSQSSKALERRRSSDFYEQPTQSLLEKVKHENVEFGRESSIVDGPERLLLKYEDVTETDFFNPKRLLEIKGLPDDEPAGRLVSFLWWFCFLLARMLAISSFAYFYPTEIIWILSSHFILVVVLLVYDAKTDEVKRAKAIFFIFIGYVYLFCLIEFKIKFKKVKFIYNLFFTLVFLENFVMVGVWWFRDMEDILNDWWYKYIFYVIITCSVFSFVSMIMYVKVFKPNKVTVDVLTQQK